MQRTKRESEQAVANQSNENKTRISTHILDTSRGRPAGNVPVRLFKWENDNWLMLSESATTMDGRCGDLFGNDRPTSSLGRYKVVFDVAKYFADLNVESMYPTIEIIFDLKNAEEHYHVPLLLSPFGFTTYRGS